jgi:RNA polymerase sigma factor (sigma-70 family)
MNEQPKVCTDMELIEKICTPKHAERPAALDRFMKSACLHLKEMLTARCRQFRFSKDVADDLFQDTFIMFEEDSKKQSLRNLCAFFIDIGNKRILVKARRKDKIAPGTTEYDFSRIPDTTAMSEMAAQLIEMDDLFTLFLDKDVSEDMAVMLNHKIADLYPDDKDIIEMFYYEDLSHRDIAKILEINESNSKNRLNRAIQKLLAAFLAGYYKQLSPLDYELLGLKLKKVTHAEISKRTGIPETEIQSRYDQVRARLRDIIRNNNKK